MTAPTQVLIVDDEERFGANLVKLLTANGLAATHVLSGEEGLEAAASTPYDVILLDMKMPGISGKETLAALRRSGCKARVVVLTGHASVDDAVELINMGAYDYLLKPCKTEQLLKMISLAHEQKLLEERPLG